MVLLLHVRYLVITRRRRRRHCECLASTAAAPVSGLGRGGERGEPGLHRGARQVDHQPMERVRGGEPLERGGARRPRRGRRRQAARQHDARRGGDSAQLQVPLLLPLSLSLSPSLSHTTPMFDGRGNFTHDGNDFTSTLKL